MTWILAGGGTGGHVTPALALGEVLRAQGEAPLFVGTERGIETKLVPGAGFELVTLDARPLIGRSVKDKLVALWALLRATVQARKLLRARAARVVVSVGGYASAPAALAGVWLRVPTVLVNTDAVPGAANRLLARFADRIFVGFEGAARAFDRPGKVEVTGVPLRTALREAFAAAAEPTRDDPRAHLFIFGGSQGARQINEAMKAALPSLDPARLHVVHQTGEADREGVEAAYREAGFDAHVTAFEHDMPGRYREADLVVCRAGAISVAELALAGRAALLVPLAHVGGGEQAANAHELEAAGAARVLSGAGLSETRFAETLAALLADRPVLRAMAKAAAGLARPDAAEEIVRRTRALLEDAA